MTTPPLVEIDGLTLRHGAVVVLDRVSLAVDPGTIHVLAGPNGAGKSSVLKAILGESAFEGTVQLHFRRDGKIGYVPQSLDFDRDLPLRVDEFLSLGRQRRPVFLGRSQVGDALEKVGMADRASRRLGALSGGELQRVLIARAIVPTPELLLLDEATAGVDDEGLRKTEEVLLALKKEGLVTTLMVSHDLDHAARIADRATLLNRTVRASGSPAEVLG